jgi:hypothetical protein
MRIAAVSRATNSVTNPAGGPLVPLGSAPRAVQNAAPRQSGVPPAGERRFVPREVVVGLASDISQRDLDELARRHGLTPVESHDIALVGTTYHRWRIADGRSVSDVIRALEAPAWCGPRSPIIVSRSRNRRSRPTGSRSI